MEKIKNIHPGEVLLEEFLIPLQISVYRLAKETFIPQSRISGIVKGNRSITADTALRLARFFGTTPHFWLGLQADFDLEVERNDHQQEIDSIQSIQDNAA
jgi:addiction module HigA family antidote